MIRLHTLHSVVTARVLTRVAALVGTLWLVVVIVDLGWRGVPAVLAPPRTVWDFTDVATPIWAAAHALVRRVDGAGLLFVPQGDVPLISSGPITVELGRYDAVRLRLKVRDPSDGQLRLRLQTPRGPADALRRFRVLGRGAFEDVTIPLPRGSPSDAVIVEVVLVPSRLAQVAEIASIGFASSQDGGADRRLIAWLGELWSPWPGKYDATRLLTAHTVAPPVVAGRSVWMVLTPIVLAAATLMLAGAGSSSFGLVVRRSALGIVVAVWMLGALLLMYHQAVALGVDVMRFGGLTRTASYDVLDGAPLWGDMTEVARFVPPGQSVEFVPDREDVTTMRWKNRAAYYLYPVPVRAPSALRIHYFGASHRGCAEIQPAAELLLEAERFCLFRVSK